MTKTYHGKPCIKCGSTEKYSSNCSCVKCGKLRDIVNRRRRTNEARIIGSIEHKRRMIDGAKNRASKKDIPFNITLDDIYIPENCPVLGIPLAVNQGGKSSHNSASLDRIIPEDGYVRGNIIVVSNRANTIKSDANPEELSMVYRYYEEKYNELVEAKKVSSMQDGSETQT